MKQHILILRGDYFWKFHGDSSIQNMLVLNVIDAVDVVETLNMRLGIFFSWKMMLNVYQKKLYLKSATFQTKFLVLNLTFMRCEKRKRETAFF